MGNLYSVYGLDKREYYCYAVPNCNGRDVYEEYTGMMERMAQQPLAIRIKGAEVLVQVGGVYCHYKDPHKRYRVLGIGLLEATQEPCVIYQAEYGDQLVWVRALSVWLERVQTEQGMVPRFRQEYSQ